MFFLPENLIKGQETKRGEKRGGKRKGVEWRLDKKRRLLFPFMASCSGMDGWYIGDRNGSWFSLGALPFRTLSFSLSLGLVSVFCSNCAGDKSGSHYRVDVFLESLFLAFQPSHSQAHILSLSLWKGTKLFLPEGCFFPPVYFFNILFRLEVSSLPFFLLNKPCHLPCGGYSGIQLQYKICTYTR